MSFMYILYGVSARKLTKEEVEQNYKSFLIKHPNKSLMTFEEYKDFMEMITKLDIDVSVSREPIAYFVDEDRAKEAAEMNIGDYNDGGVNEYGLIEKLPMGVAYPYTGTGTQYNLYRYDRMTRHYTPIKFSLNELTKAIQTKYDIFAFDRGEE